MNTKTFELLERVMRACDIRLVTWDCEVDSFGEVKWDGEQWRINYCQKQYVDDDLGRAIDTLARLHDHRTPHKERLPIESRRIESECNTKSIRKGGKSV